MLWNSSSLLQFLFIGQQGCVKGDFVIGKLLLVVKKMNVAAATSVTPRFQPRINIEGLFPDKVQAFWSVNLVSNQVDFFPDPFEIRWYTNRKIVPTLCEGVDIFLAVEPSVEIIWADPDL